jgi:hypothetical protein
MGFKAVKPDKSVAKLPPETWRRVKIQATCEDCSIKDLIIRILDAYCDSGPARAARREK